MFDIGWTELVLVGIVALIVIGPEDLPDMFRQIGRFTAKIRAMSREFSKAMEAAAKEAGVKDVAKDLKTMTSPKSLGLNAVKEAADKFEKWDPLKASTARQAAKNPATAAAAEGVSSGEPVKPAVTPEVEPAAIGLNHGPATRALYEKKVAKRTAAQEKAASAKAEDGLAVAAKPAAQKPAAQKPAAQKPAAQKPAAAKLAAAEPSKAKSPEKHAAKSPAKPAIGAQGKPAAAKPKPTAIAKPVKGTPVARKSRKKADMA
jgi:sec-independent protein translocase protein TatB